jgi:CTP:molybdopterin cytidylyltransferase MocA/xanthine/CO dehydrogenase XdhC/CoxF family maturation factor
MEARQPGTLVTTISNNDKEGTSVVRNWIPLTDIEKNKVPPELIAAKEAIQDCLAEKKTKYLVDAMPAIFIQPAIPLPRLVIAGAGHIGKALAHLGDLLEFEVTVIDDREEYCNEDRIPDAHHLVVRDIGEAIRLDPKTPDTYLVIVTRGHRDDAAALRNAIDSGMAYIGMIGSKTKVAMMRRQFIEEGWATSRQLERVFAPIGLDIRSKTVQEIAISIAAQLVMVRQQSQTGKDRVGAVILAAGESKRMGTPKQLLPFGESTMIEEIIGTLKASNVANIIVVLGAHFDAIASRLEKYPVAIARNRQYKKGMLTSLQAGLKKLPDDTTKIAVLLGDQPMIRADIINQLIHALGHSDKTMAVPVYNKKWGHPVLLEAIHREGIEGLGPDQTLRDYLQAHRGDILEVAMNHPEIHRDIDTIDDYHNELKYRR